MKHYVTPTCKQKCRFLQITDGLWLCPHAAYGEATDKKGAVEEGRALLARAGGYEAVVARVLAAEAVKREEQRKKKEGKVRRLAESLRYE